MIGHFEMENNTNGDKFLQDDFIEWARLSLHEKKYSKRNMEVREDIPHYLYFEKKKTSNFCCIILDNNNLRACLVIYPVFPSLGSPVYNFF